MEDETNPDTGINQDKEAEGAIVMASRSTLQNFLKLRDKVPSPRIKWTPELVREITALVHEIPYFPDAFRDEVLDTIQRWQSMNSNANAVAVAISPLSEVANNVESYINMGLLDERNLRWINSVPQEMQLEFAHLLAKYNQALAERMAKQNQAIAERDQAIALANLYMKVHRMHHSIDNVSYSLHNLVQVSPGDRTMQSNMGTETLEAAQACIPQNYQCAGNLHSEAVKKLVGAKCKLHFDEPRNNQEGKQGSEERLQKVAEAWQSWIDGINEQTSEDSAKIDGLTWMRNKIKNPNLTTTPLPFPGVMTNDVAATQPALEALLTCIFDCFNEDCTPQNHSGDLRLDRPGLYMFQMYNHASNLFLEVKPLLRQRETLESLHNQCFEQTLAHLAKLVYEGLNLFGIGTSTFATGITGNLAYISVYKLELIMQPPNSNGSIAELQLHESDRLPLMTKSCFNKWTKNFLAGNIEKVKKREEEINLLKCQLYGAEENDGGATSENIPLGIWVLWDLIKKPHQDLFGPNYKELFSLGSQNELLGSGAFSFVFSFLDGKAVLKAGIYSFSDHLKKEISILQKLGRQWKDIDELALPVLNDVLELPIVLGGVRTTSKGLVLSPRGNGIQSFSKAVGNLGLFLDRIIPTLVGALKFIHEKHIVHNDISPKNIIVQGDELDGRAFLIDFGCASDDREHITGFVGTSSYAHVDVHRHYPNEKWKPKSKYDFFSLGLAMSSLVLQSAAKWNMGRFPVSLSCTEVKKELKVLNSKRVKMAKDLAEQSGCQQNTKDIWMRCLNGESIDRRKRAYRTRSCNDCSKN